MTRVLVPAFILVLLILALLLFVAAAPASAGGFGVRGWGPRAGLVIDPDQVRAGLHLDVAELPGHLRFQPNMEVGVGDGLRVFTINLDTAWRFSSRWDAWVPYLGGGVGLHFIDPERGDRRDGARTDAGLSLLGGIERGLSGGNRFFLESKLGMMDSPEFQLTMGWTIRE